ncbi:MAG: MmgE/PrpD family protein [Rhodoglobus sp.]
MTDTVAEFVSEGPVPFERSDLMECALRPIIDTIGCIVAGLSTPTGDIAAEYVADGSPRGFAEIAGRARSGFERERVALVLGTAGSALDFDDVSAIGHPSAVLLAAVLASGPQRLSGPSVLEAYLVGYEVSTRLGQAMTGAHSSHGWHATSTTGFFAAAATAARLLRLNVPQTRHALGIAASMAAGITRNFGTETKPFHSGLAARGGVAAAELARLGVDSGSDSLDGPRGFLDMYALGQADLGPLKRIGGHWAMDERPPTLKKYPSCYASHRPIDAAIHVQEQHGIRVEDIESVLVLGPARAMESLTFPRPENGLQAKFSPTYPVAAALVDRAVTISSFADERVRRAEIHEIIDVMTVRENPARREGQPTDGSTIDAGFWEVSVRTKRGDVFSAHCAEAPGTASRQLTWTEIQEKFRDCCAHGGIDASATDQVFSELRALPAGGDLRECVSALVTGPESEATTHE